MTNTERRLIGPSSRLRLALVAALVGVVLVAAAVAAVAAIRASDRAAAADDVAASRALAAAAMRNLDDEPDLAIVLALEAFRRVRDRPAAESYEARSSLVSTLTRYPHLAAVLHVDGGAAAVEFSSDGRRLATSDAHGTTRLWDVRRRAQLGRAMQGQRTCFAEPVDVDVRFTPGDKALAQTACGAASVFDPSSGRRLRQLGGPTDEHGEEETDGLLSPDGRFLVFEGEWSGTRVLDLETSKAILENQAPLNAYRYHDAISGNSRVLATSRGLSGVVRRSTRLSSLRSGATVARQVPGRVVALSPRGDVAVVVTGGSVSLWNVGRGRAIGSPLLVRDVLRAAFDQSGRRLAISSDDGSVHVWWLTRTWRPVAPIRLRQDGVLGLRFDPSGDTLATAAPDGQVRLWDVTTRWPLLERIHAAPSLEVVFGPDSELLVANLVEGTAIWRTLPGGRVGNAEFVDEGIGSDIVFSHDGHSLVSVHNDPGSVVTWDVAAKRVSREIKTWDYEMDDGVAFSPDRRLVAASDDWGLRFWDRVSGRLSGKPRAAFEPLAFSPDGRLLLSGSQSQSGSGDEKHTLRFWDVEKRELLHVSSEGTEPLDFAFSPDGSTVAVAEEDRVIGLWDVHRRTPIDRLNVDPLSTGCCYADLEFTPDGSTLAAALTTSLTLWDTASRARLGDPVRLGDNELADELWDVDVRPDGRALAVAGERGVFLLDPLLLSRDLRTWSRRLCRIANRALTEFERRRYLGGESSGEICSAG